MSSSGWPPRCSCTGWRPSCSDLGRDQLRALVVLRDWFGDLEVLAVYEHEHEREGPGRGTRGVPAVRNACMASVVRIRGAGSSTRPPGRVVGVVLEQGPLAVSSGAATSGAGATSAGRWPASVARRTLPVAGVRCWSTSPRRPAKSAAWSTKPVISTCQSSPVSARVATPGPLGSPARRGDSVTLDGP
jgi:hypothetical protein